MGIKFYFSVIITVLNLSASLQAAQAPERLEQQDQATQREISPKEQTQLNQELAALLDRDGFEVSFKQALNLVEQGADINTQSLAHGLTLLGAAIFQRDENAVKEIIDKGAHVNSPTLRSITPLDWAIHHNNSKIVKILLDKGALINQLKIEETLLDQAIRQINYHANLAETKEIVKMLLDYGADPFAKDSRGRTPRMIAQGIAQGYHFWSNKYQTAQSIIKMLKDRERYYMEVFETSHPAKKMKLPQKAIEAHLKSKNTLATCGEAACDLGDMISEYLPSTSIIPPYTSTLTPQEWDTLEMLTERVQQNKLSPDDEEKFEQLVETIQRETHEARAYATPEHQKLLNSALRSWDLLRARKSID